jgi:hypothetical protein
MVLQYNTIQWYLSNEDTFGAIQSVIICAFGTNGSVLIKEVSLLRGPVDKLHVCGVV